MCFDRDQRMLQQLQAEHADAGERLVTMDVDVTDVDAVTAGVDIAVAKCV